MLDPEIAPAPHAPHPRARGRRTVSGARSTVEVAPARDAHRNRGPGGAIDQAASGTAAESRSTILRLFDPQEHALDRRAPVDPPGHLSLAAKRAIDLLGATAGLVLLGPLLLGTAALIALVDGRPVLFRQDRAGLRERPFRIYKFRTMRDGADAEREALRANNEVAGGASFKMTDDPRVTRLGGFLRRTSIDEFPQLLNVLQGDMSLVGPRPHPFDDVAGYQPWHHARTAMKPGMTGLWQVSSRRNPDFDRWVELDLEYIRTWSAWLDVKIIARTIPAMVRSEGR